VAQACGCSGLDVQLDAVGNICLAYVVAHWWVWQRQSSAALLLVPRCLKRKLKQICSHLVNVQRRVLQNRNMAAPADASKVPCIVAQVDLALPQHGKVDPLIGIDVVCHEATIAKAAAGRGGAWGVPVELRRCPVDHRSMKAVGGGQLQVAAFRPQLGAGFEFVPPVALEESLTHALSHVRCHSCLTCDAGKIATYVQKLGICHTAYRKHSCAL
jgi:hypothetical protein